MDVGIEMKARKMSVAGRGVRDKDHGPINGRHKDNNDGQKGNVIAYMSVYLMSKKHVSSGSCHLFCSFLCVWMFREEGGGVTMYEGFSYAGMPVKGQRMIYNGRDKGQ